MEAENMEDEIWHVIVAAVAAAALGVAVGVAAFVFVAVVRSA